MLFDLTHFETRTKGTKSYCLSIHNVLQKSLQNSKPQLERRCGRSRDFPIHTQQGRKTSIDAQGDTMSSSGSFVAAADSALRLMHLSHALLTSLPVACRASFSPSSSQHKTLHTAVVPLNQNQQILLCSTRFETRRLLQAQLYPNLEQGDVWTTGTTGLGLALPTSRQSLSSPQGHEQ